MTINEKKINSIFSNVENNIQMEKKKTLKDASPPVVRHLNFFLRGGGQSIFILRRVIQSNYFHFQTFILI